MEPELGMVKDLELEPDMELEPELGMVKDLELEPDMEPEPELDMELVKDQEQEVVCIRQELHLTEELKEETVQL